MEPPLPESGKPQASVQTPFGQCETTVDAVKKNFGRRVAIWIIALSLAALAGVASFALVRMLSDPLRLVEEFPFQRYYDNPHALAGNRFKGDFDVVEHLGREEGFGRLIVVASAKTSDPVVVLLPPKLDEASLRSGQRITTELRVQDDGLIEVISLRAH
jgi:hypothetical protein